MFFPLPRVPQPPGRARPRPPPSLTLLPPRPPPPEQPGQCDHHSTFTLACPPACVRAREISACQKSLGADGGGAGAYSTKVAGLIPTWGAFPVWALRVLPASAAYGASRVAICVTLTRERGGDPGGGGVPAALCVCGPAERSQSVPGTSRTRRCSGKSSDKRSGSNGVVWLQV